MRNLLLTFAVTATLLTTSGATANIEPGYHDGLNQVAAVEWHACKHEDGSGQRRCVWDARHMGNGEGRSFLIRRGGTNSAKITFIRHYRAHRLAGI